MHHDGNALTQSLNPAQQEAVTAPPSNLLVIAGAGSGKTRVLVQRIAWLIKQHGVSPFSIMAVTFTNKAARQMQFRVEELLNIPSKSMWIGTFHGLAHRFLRRHWEAAGLDQNFQILDADDQLRIIKRIHKSMNLDEAKWPPKKSQWFINQQKEKGQRAKQVLTSNNPFIDTLRNVYSAYETQCTRGNLVDFTELLLRSYELCKQNNEILEHYHGRFQEFLVDEFQDTNPIQYNWLKLLVSPHAHLMAVGDDDQSIYSWRGARIENIHNVSKDFPNTKTIRMEQNYRSTGTILNAANSVIAHNTCRLGKKLWTDGAQGDQITVYTAFHETDEAQFVIQRIREHLRSQASCKEIAILYRSNAQSRVLEDQLLHAGIPYQIYGGFKFFERAEVKDALGYLRLIANRHDDPAFERVINTPARGIGMATVESIRQTAREQVCSLWTAAQHALRNHALAARSSKSVALFLQLIEHMAEESAEWGLPRQTEHVLNASGLLAHHQQDKSEKGRSRVENLEELISATESFHSDDETLTELNAFLAEVALDTGESQSKDNQDSIQLMTLHSAKGLEFPIVFLTGLEDGLFPHRMCLTEPEGLEEERRLCYVGMTRAMKRLYLSHAQSRRIHGREEYQTPSRFLEEIPPELLNMVRVTTRLRRPTPYAASPPFNRGTYTRRAPSPSPNPSHITPKTSAIPGGLKIGQTVRHKKFGEGIILNYEGSGAHARLHVRFKQGGDKWLVMQFANLERV